MQKKARRIGFTLPVFSEYLVYVTAKALYTIWEGKCLQGVNHNVSLSLTLFFMLKWLSTSGEEKEADDGKVHLKYTSPI